MGGTETYASGLLYGLAQINDMDDFVVFVNREGAEFPIPSASNFRKVPCRVSAVNRGKRYFYEQFILPNLARKLNVEILHSLGYVAPLHLSCRSIVTIPDVNYITMGHTLPLLRRWMLSLVSRRSAKNADHIITISEFSKSEIGRLLGIDSSKITVTHLGPRVNLKEANPNEWFQLGERYKITKPYIAAFGGGALHKNIRKLIEAYDAIRDEIEHCLVLIGHLPSDVRLAVEEMGKELKNRIIATGYVPEDHIMPLLRNSDLYILPSLYEGFGLPVLEAQQAGVPVVCSRVGSIPEIAGQGALYFDPTSTKNISDVIKRALKNDGVRLELIRKGSANLEKYSWEKTARETLQVYIDVLPGNG